MHGATLKIVDAKQARLHKSFKITKCKLLRKINERKSAGETVMAQSTGEAPMKMVMKKERNM
jgi:hypothetical protein